MCLKKRGVGKKKKKDYKFLAFNLLKKKKQNNRKNKLIVEEFSLEKVT